MKQQLKLHGHFSRLWAIFHERELLMTGFVVNLLVIALFGLASNPPHFQTYAQLFEGPEFEVPEAPGDCGAGRCVYSYNSGEWYKKESAPGGGFQFTPCQSATTCGGNSGGSGSSGGSGGSGSSGSTGNTAGINNPNCATSVGCSQVNQNGSTIFCVSGLCTECNAGGSCARAGEWPANIVNNGNFCSGPGCAPGSIPPTQCAAGSTSCTAQSPGSGPGPGQLNYTQVMIGNQLVEFEAGSTVSKDKKYTRTCASAGSCMISPNTGGGNGSSNTVPGYRGNGRSSNPFILDPNQGANATNNPCSTISGPCYISGPNGTSVCINNGTFCSPSSNAQLPNYQAPGSQTETTGDGTYSNPYRLSNLEQLKSQCGSAAGACFGFINDTYYRCLNGSCGAFEFSGQGTISDPVVVSNFEDLTAICAPAARCYGLVDGILYFCNSGQCGMLVSDPKGGANGFSKGNPPQWPGDPSRGIGVYSVNGKASQPVFVCGDLICSGNETPASCPQDCGGSNIACTVGQARRLVCE